MRARPTLADVAALAGVSPSTASNVLRDRPHVAPETRAAVRAAAAAIGYQPDVAARGLSSGRTGRIAVIVPNLYQPYFAELAERLILAVENEGLTTTLRLAPTPEAQHEALTGTASADTDAALLCPHFEPPQRRPGPADRPVVQLGGPVSPHLDCVIMGEREGAAAVAEHVLATGRRRIALIWDRQAGDGARYQGVADAFAAHGMRIDPELFAVGSDWDRRDSGYEAVTGLLRAGRAFDTVLCANDATAVGALRALRVNDIDVPGDVAVTGFDDTDECRFTIPTLTSVSPEQETMVATAVAMLQERLAGFTGPARHVTTGAHVVERGSTAVLGRASTRR